ncbi:DUF2953 domain-containing protein [Chachezhania sediminis]|uniref:DUF2953 domain-containing protein n=1 Tax=Chachezhania sediminis TaxID=2599291 RepID=UPI00131ECEDA|nr:DUF2953 domain-containing protein [Chachezhania sediminis]
MPEGFEIALDVVQVLIGLVILALAIALVLPVRFRCVAGAGRDTGPFFRATVAPLNGLIPEIKLAPIDRPEDQEPPAWVQDAAARAQDHVAGNTDMRRSVLLREGWRCIVRILRHIHFDLLRLDATVGLGDPATTGEFYGKSMAVTQSLRVIPNVAILIRPDFDGPVIEGEIEADLRVRPISVLIPLIRFGIVLQWKGRK